jgi:hypothetical protein
MARMRLRYDLSVFVNCPFDHQYKPLLDALIFAIHDCGFSARIALEDVGGSNRLNKLLDLIETSRYSIHDLSRIQEPRLNMAFECGLVFGAKHFGTAKHKQKDMLILDADDHQYQRTMSDVSGQDAGIHHNDPDQVIHCVRSFLARKSRKKPMRGHQSITRRYQQFREELPRISKEANLTVDELAGFDYLPDLLTLMVVWIARTP